MLKGRGLRVCIFSRSPLFHSSSLNRGGGKPMSLVLTQAGELKLLERMLSAYTEDISLHLFSNNTAPTNTSTAAQFTESAFTGYTAATLGTWATATTVNGVGSKSCSAGSTFQNTSTTAATVWGYYLTGATSSVVYWAEQFASARTLNQNDQITITPQFSFGNGTPA